MKLHLLNKHGVPLCGASSEAVTTHAPDVDCKRCLKRLHRGSIPKSQRGYPVLTEKAERGAWARLRHSPCLPTDDENRLAEWMIENGVTTLGEDV